MAVTASNVMMPPALYYAEGEYTSIDRAWRDYNADCVSGGLATMSRDAFRKAVKEA